MKRRYNHDTKQWDIVLSEMEYLKLYNNSPLSRWPTSDRYLAWCKHYDARHAEMPIQAHRLPDGADLAGIDMIAHNNLGHIRRFKGFGQIEEVINGN
jgi:hypothetical protein